MTDNEKQKPIDRFEKEIDAKKQHEVDSKMGELRAEASRWERRYNEALDDFNLFKSKSQWLSTLSETYKEEIAVEPLSKTGTGEGAAILMLSDWHVYEVVKPETVSGLNTFNPEICQISVNNLFNGAMAWIDIHRQSLKIKTLMIALLGDFITNMLYEDQKTGNAGLVQEETLFATRLLVGGIRFLKEAGNFDRIILACCAGNHSRPQKEKNVANSAVNTYEWLMYKFMEEWILPPDGVIEWQISNGYHNFVNLYGKWLRLHHGDQVRYQGGVGGLTIPMNKAIKAWNVGRKADLDLTAHYHQFMFPGLFVGNSSLIGYSPFALSVKGEYEKPSQTLLIADSKRFITSYNPIYVR